MLVLSRHCDAEVCIGPDITVKVLEIRGRQVKLGIEAPNWFSIWRGELASAARGGTADVERSLSRREQSCLATPPKRHSSQL
jgi:carbon storage regulator